MLAAKKTETNKKLNKIFFSFVFFFKKNNSNKIINTSNNKI